MEDLLAEINTKRKALDDLDRPGEGSSSSSSGQQNTGPSKYMRRADVERASEEDGRKKRTEAREKERATKMRREAESAKKSSLARLSSPFLNRSSTSDQSTSSTSTAQLEGFNISPEECIRRLRAKAQPIRLFGETDKDRRLRLRALELSGEKGSNAQGYNDFRKLMVDLDSGYEAREEERKAKMAHRAGAAATLGMETAVAAKEDAGGDAAASGDGPGAEGKDILDGVDKKAEKRRGQEGILDLSLYRTDPNKLYPIVYWFWKNLIQEWGDWLDNRPDEVKRSTQGKLAAANQAASLQHLKPLFKQIRSRALAPDVLRLMSEIVHYTQQRMYQQANDAYLRMSIGNAAWPIGVTSVGLHERSADQKIAQDVVAHVMNDEVSRKWIQAIKRLLTFSQTIRPPADISQIMG